MTSHDKLFILNLILKSLFFLAFVYLDRKTWSWKKGFCVIALVEVSYQYPETTEISSLVLLLIYALTVVIALRILAKEKNSKDRIELQN